MDGSLSKNFERKGKINMKILLLSDIHGNEKSFLEILKLAGGENNYDFIMILGDMVDRGPDSLKILKWFMKGKNRVAILGNHEQLILSYFEIQAKYSQISNKHLKDLAEATNFLGNGCLKTINQLNKLNEKERNKILDWMRNLNILKKIKIFDKEYAKRTGIDKLILTHAPFMKRREETNLQFNLDKMWNIKSPEELKRTFTIHGHTGRCSTFYDDGGIARSIGIDSMHQNKLTAVAIDTNNFDLFNFEVFEIKFDPKILYGKKENKEFEKYAAKDWSDSKW